MQLTFLEAKIPLTKRFKRTASSFEKESYPHAARFTSHPQQATAISELAQHVASHAALGHCLLKGNTTKPLKAESRKHSTKPDDPTDWICLDIDGLPSKTTIEQFLSAMDLQNVSYVLQYSASYGIESKQLRAHVFIELTTPVAPSILKQWLIDRNYSVPLLTKSLSLTSTNLALRYGLDITTCQNDKLLYIAPPELIGIADPLAGTDRIQYVERQHPTFSLDVSKVPTPEANRIATNKVINALRKKAGIAERQFNVERTTEFAVLNNPDAAQVTEMKQDRDFVYLNLNGGDSWGYYHPIKHPELIHNFKGEPVYRTCELLPEYWAALGKEPPAPPVTRTTEPEAIGSALHLAFLDRNNGSYWRGTYYPDTELLDLRLARTETIVRHFMKSHGMPLGDFIPEWELTYDPHDPVKLDEQRRRINMFQPSPYMHAKPTPRDAPPPTILRMIYHALGSDETITRRFINWLAYIVQFRTRAETAWVLHGTQGTGKGILVEQILKPLLGDTNVAKLTQHNVDENWNPYMKSCLIVFLDEMEHTALKNSSSVMAKIKNWITEPAVQIREMNRVAYPMPNFASFIFASNRPDPVKVDREDRRFNVARYQKDRLHVTTRDIAQIRHELQAFHDFLMCHQVNEIEVRTPISTGDRDNMMALSETAVDQTVNALQSGSFVYFMDALPTDDRYKEDAAQLMRVEAYQKVLKILIERTEADGECKIARDELRSLFEYVCGNMPTSSNKFTSLLRHHRMVTETIRVGDKTPKGVHVVWTDPAYVKDQMQQFVKAPVHHLKVVK